MALQIKTNGCKKGTLFENSFHSKAQATISTLSKIFVKLPKMGLAKNVHQNLNFSGCFSHILAN